MKINRIKNSETTANNNTKQTKKQKQKKYSNKFSILKQK